MRVEVTVPPEYAGDVTRNLAGRRSRFQSQEDRGGAQVINARVPLAEMLGYATDLRSRTQGRGTFLMTFDRYEVIPRAGDGGAPDSLVRTPRRPSPTPRGSRVALPELEGEDAL